MEFISQDIIVHVYPTAYFDMSLKIEKEFQIAYYEFCQFKKSKHTSNRNDRIIIASTILPIMYCTCNLANK